MAARRWIASDRDRGSPDLLLPWSLRGHPQSRRYTHGDERLPADDLHDRAPSEIVERLEFLGQFKFIATGQIGLSTRPSVRSCKPDPDCSCRHLRGQSTWEPDSES